jgi:DNA-binding beta-propeller fold protein YncE
MNALPLLFLCALAAQDEENAPRPRRIGIYAQTMTATRSPSAIAIDGGRLLVAESEWDRVTSWTGEGFATADSSNAKFGTGGPHGIAVSTGADGKKVVFVTRSGFGRIYAFDADGQLLANFGNAGDKPGNFRDPHGIAATPSALYVCDTGSDRVQKLALDGRPLGEYGRRGHGEGELLRPLGVAVDSAGFVYVTDSGNHRVHKLDADLKLVKTFGDFGPHPGFFAFPDGIACFENEVYVVDTDNHRVQVFDSEGAVRYEWGLHALLPREGEGKLHYPSGIAIDPHGGDPRVWISEPQEDRIQSFRVVGPEEAIPTNPPGTRVVAAHYGPHVSVGLDVLALSEPSAPSLVLYDIESDTKPWEPILITRMAMWGRRPGQLLTPTDIEVDWPNKLLYVADADARTLSCWHFNHDEHRPTGFDFFMLKFVRSVDFERLHELKQDDSEFTIQPEAIELTPDGRSVWVIDSLQKKIFALPAEFGSCERVWVECGERPVDLAFTLDASAFYVIDELERSLCRFENKDLLGYSDRKWRDVVVKRSRGVELVGPRKGTEFQRPGGIAVAPEGSIFVSDLALHRITKLDPSGKVLATFGTQGIGRIEFHRPRGLDVDEFGRLWIVDWGNHRGQVLSASGEFLGAYGSRPFIRPTFKRD